MESLQQQLDITFTRNALRDICRSFNITIALKNTKAGMISALSAYMYVNHITVDQLQRSQSPTDDESVAPAEHTVHSNAAPTTRSHTQRDSLSKQATTARTEGAQCRFQTLSAAGSTQASTHAAEPVARIALAQSADRELNHMSRCESTSNGSAADNNGGAYHHRAVYEYHSKSDDRRSDNAHQNRSYREYYSSFSDSNGSRSPNLHRYRARHRSYSRDSTCSDEYYSTHFRERNRYSPESERSYECYRKPHRRYSPARDHTKYCNREKCNVDKLIHPRYIDFESYRLDNGKLFCPKCLDIFHSYGECTNYSCDDKYTIPRLCPNDVRVAVQEEYDNYIHYMLERKGMSFLFSSQRKRMGSYRKGGPYGYNYVPPVFYSLSEDKLYSRRSDDPASRCKEILTKQREEMHTPDILKPRTPYINTAGTAKLNDAVLNATSREIANTIPQKLDLCETLLNEISGDLTAPTSPSIAEKEHPSQSVNNSVMQRVPQINFLPSTLLKQKLNEMISIVQSIRPILLSILLMPHWSIFAILHSIRRCLPARICSTYLLVYYHFATLLLHPHDAGRMRKIFGYRNCKGCLTTRKRTFTGCLSQP
ncbi:uncharacterized protein LOC129596729 [Paramacrobiotus metropolitanus]|uniref:uncharacterized protein LOC129596729 n=1 Tax=Paramacrobiotus metropolitanus TaxID=2943436 RepID=UPI002445A5BC|nr:uncharacterized protein LOC129596729 [Paramacrobiotus metropolitanus]